MDIGNGERFPTDVAYKPLSKGFERQSLVKFAEFGFDSPKKITIDHVDGPQTIALNGYKEPDEKFLDIVVGKDSYEASLYTSDLVEIMAGMVAQFANIQLEESLEYDLAMAGLSKNAKELGNSVKGQLRKITELDIAQRLQSLKEHGAKVERRSLWAPDNGVRIQRFIIGNIVSKGSIEEALSWQADNACIAAMLYCRDVLGLKTPDSITIYSVAHMDTRKDGKFPFTSDLTNVTECGGISDPGRDAVVVFERAGIFGGKNEEEVRGEIDTELSLIHTVHEVGHQCFRAGHRSLREGFSTALAFSFNVSRALKWFHDNKGGRVDVPTLEGLFMDKQALIPLQNVYFLSAALFSFVSEKYGKRKLATMCKLLDKTKDIVGSIKETYGVDEAEIEEALSEFVKLANSEEGLA